MFGNCEYQHNSIFNFSTPHPSFITLTVTRSVHISGARLDRAAVAAHTADGAR
jgi:hypothetical protein